MAGRVAVLVRPWVDFKESRSVLFGGWRVEDLTSAVTAYRNSEYTLIRKYAYVFNVLLITLSK